MQTPSMMTECLFRFLKDTSCFSMLLITVLSTTYNSEKVIVINKRTEHFLISLNLDGRRGTTDDVATVSFYLSLSNAALRESLNPIPVHSLIEHYKHKTNFHFIFLKYNRKCFQINPKEMKY